MTDQSKIESFFSPETCFPGLMTLPLNKVASILSRKQVKRYSSKPYFGYKRIDLMGEKEFSFLARFFWLKGPLLYSDFSQDTSFLKRGFFRVLYGLRLLFFWSCVLVFSIPLLVLHLLRHFVTSFIKLISYSSRIRRLKKVRKYADQEASLTPLLEEHISNILDFTRQKRVIRWFDLISSGLSILIPVLFCVSFFMNQPLSVSVVVSLFLGSLWAFIMARSISRSLALSAAGFIADKASFFGLLKMKAMLRKLGIVSASGQNEESSKVTEYVTQLQEKYHTLRQNPELVSHEVIFKRYSQYSDDEKEKTLVNSLFSFMGSLEDYEKRRSLSELFKMTPTLKHSLTLKIVDSVRQSIIDHLKTDMELTRLLFKTDEIDSLKKAAKKALYFEQEYMDRLFENKLIEHIKGAPETAAIYKILQSVKLDATTVMDDPASFLRVLRR